MLLDHMTVRSLDSFNSFLENQEMIKKMNKTQFLFDLIYVCKMCSTQNTAEQFKRQISIIVENVYKTVGEDVDLDLLSKLDANALEYSKLTSSLFSSFFIGSNTKIDEYLMFHIELNLKYRMTNIFQYR